MEKEDEKRNLVLKYLELIDVSTEDDFLIAYPTFDSVEDLRLSVKLDNMNELFGFEDSSEVDNAAESTNRGRPSFLRKSLAWDSAFFTSPGVLDPEELRIVNKGFDATEACLPPGIQENIRTRRFDDAESPYESNGFCVKSLDSYPFKHVINKNNKMSDMKFESGFGQGTLHKFRASKKLDAVNGNRVKSMPTSKSPRSIKPQRPKMESHTPSSGESNIKFLKPRKLSGGVNSMLTQSQRTSLGTPCNVKSGSKTGRLGPAEYAKLSKSTTPPPKSYSKLSLTASESSVVSLSSYDTAPSSSSSKYSFNSTRRKLGLKTNNLGSPGFSIHSSLLISNSSSQTSPSCSVDGLSLESYFSTPSTNQNYNSPEPRLNSCVQSSTSQGMRSTRNLKPSGLRMPSPKIGFFDEKPAVAEIRGNPKFQSEKHTPESGIIKQGFAQYASQIKAKDSTHVPYNDSPLESSVPRMTRKCRVTDSKSKSHTILSPRKDREGCSKIRKVGSGQRDKRKVDTPSSSKVDESRAKLKLMTNKEQRDNSGIHIERDQKLCCRNEKENSSKVEDEVSCLSRYFEVIDISRDMKQDQGVSNSSGETGNCLENVNVPSELSKPSNRFSGQTRTPLADRTSVWNRRESREKLV